MSNPLKTSFQAFLDRISSSKNSSFQKLITVIPILVAAFVLGYMVYQQRELLLSQTWRFRWDALAFSFLTFSLALLIASLTWAWIMNSLGQKISYIRHIRYYCISNLSKRIPGTVWYIANRAQLYKDEGISRRITSLASGMELAVFILSGIFVTALFAIPIATRYRFSIWILAIILVIGVIFLHPRVIRRIFALLNIQAPEVEYRNLLGWLVAYSVVWMQGGIVLFAIGNALVPISLGKISYVIGSWVFVGVLSTALFFSPSNFGVTEIGLSLLLTNIMPAPTAVIITIITRISLILYEIFWALILLAIKNPAKINPWEPEGTEEQQ